MITIQFEITKDGHTLKDAIVLPKNHSYSTQDIEDMKQQRFQAFYELVTAIPEDEEVIVEEE